MIRATHVAAAAVLALSAASAGAAAPAVFEADTKPSQDVTLSFTRPGLVSELNAQEGQVVEAETLLVRLDDRAERLQLAQYKAEADNDVQRRAAQAQLEQSKVVLARTREMLDNGAATELEVKEAELQVTIDDLKYELADFQLQQAKSKYEEADAQVQRMQIRCPVDGRVQDVFVSRGESVDALQEVVRVVRVDPLWVDVYVPVGQARQFEPGQRARVAVEGTSETVDGKILHISSVAYGAIPPTLRVRVEVPNPSHRPAGEPVRVSFPDVPEDDSVARKESD